MPWEAVESAEKVTQFISFGARHKSRQQQADNRLGASSIFHLPHIFHLPAYCRCLLGGRRDWPTNRLVIYDFVNLVQTERTSSLPKSFVLHVHRTFFRRRTLAALLRNRTWNEITHRQSKINAVNWTPDRPRQIPEMCEMCLEAVYLKVAVKVFLLLFALHFWPVSTSIRRQALVFYDLFFWGTAFRRLPDYGARLTNCML